MVSLLIARALLKLPCGANSIVGQRGRVILYQNFAYELKRYAHVAVNDPAPGIAPATAWFLAFCSGKNRLASGRKDTSRQASPGSIPARPGVSGSPISAGLLSTFRRFAIVFGRHSKFVWAHCDSPKGFQSVATPGEGGSGYVFSRYAPAGLDAAPLKSAEHSKL